MRLAMSPDNRIIFTDSGMVRPILLGISLVRLGFQRMTMGIIHPVGSTTRQLLLA